MDSKYEVVFYQKSDGGIPVRDFMTKLPHGLRAKAARDLELLQTYGPELRMPYSRYIRDGVFELRIQLANDIARVFYFFYVGKESLSRMVTSRRRKRYRNVS